MTGAATLLKTLVPTAAHNQAAQAIGEDAAAHFLTLTRQIADCSALARHLLDQMTRANPRDPNIATLKDVAERLS